jgi:hypothetical protein
MTPALAVPQVVAVGSQQVDPALAIWPYFSRTFATSVSLSLAAMLSILRFLGKIVHQVIECARTASFGRAAHGNQQQS